MVIDPMLSTPQLFDSKNNLLDLHQLSCFKALHFTSHRSVAKCTVELQAVTHMHEKVKILYGLIDLMTSVYVNIIYINSN
jgi:hypothetical protein